MASIEGKATAITVITPLKRRGPFVLWLVFWVGRNVTATLRKLQMLSFIHYARWAIVKRFPDGGSGERLGHSYLLFESNFNGSWEQYIDAFSEIVPARMKAIWASSYGFPGPLPVEPFKQYIRENEIAANHYFSAYPGASTTEIISAARVQTAVEELSSRCEAMDDEAFAAAHRALITRLQGDL
jgi:hypothetical protein